MGRWIKRQRYIIDFTLSSLLRRKGRNVGLLLAYSLTIFMLASVIFFTHSLREEASIILNQAPEMVVQRVVAGRHDLMPVRYLNKIREIRGVISGNGRLWGYHYDPVVGANYTLIVPEDFQYGVGNVAIGEGISRSRLVYKGDRLLFRSYAGKPVNLKIVELLSSESEIISSDLILISEKDFRNLTGISNEYVTDATLRVRNQRELTTIAGKLTTMLPDTRPIIKDEILRTYKSIFNWRAGIMLVLLSGACLAFIIFAWTKASGLSAEEKREIGILKALGWETSDVLMMKFWEGALVSFLSFLAGIIFAYVHVFFTSSTLFEPALKGWSVLYPDFKLMPFIDAGQISTLFVLTVIPYTVATIIPSWRAAIADPDSAMR